jgi:hypothetical protein
MALSSDTLKNKLLVFCDASDANFEGFPTTRKEARDKWATAFDTYITTIDEKIAWPPPLVGKHPTLLLAKVKSTFFDTLALAPLAVAQPTAVDFGNAWQAAIAAITPGTGGTDSTGMTYSLFTAFTNITLQYADLVKALAKLFSAPTTDVKAQIGDIAGAFHTATTGLLAAMTQTAPNGVTAPAAIGVQ